MDREGRQEERAREQDEGARRVRLTTSAVGYIPSLPDLRLPRLSSAAAPVFPEHVQGSPTSAGVAYPFQHGQGDLFTCVSSVLTDTHCSSDVLFAFLRGEWSSQRSLPILLLLLLGKGPDVMSLTCDDGVLDR